MSKFAKKIHFPTTRLAELAARSGGITRQQALDEADKALQAMLEMGVETMGRALVAIEKIAYSAKAGMLSPEQMNEVLREADQIVTMAATFKFTGLEEAAKSLCDIAAGLHSHGMPDAAPILVHVQSMRLMSPGSPELSAEASAHVLGELAKVRTKYKFERLCADAPVETGPDIGE
jgi:hypothetical protein